MVIRAGREGLAAASGWSARGDRAGRRHERTASGGSRRVRAASAAPVTPSGRSVVGSGQSRWAWRRARPRSRAELGRRSARWAGRRNRAGVAAIGRDAHGAQRRQGCSSWRRGAGSRGPEQISTRWLASDREMRVRPRRSTSRCVQAGGARASCTAARPAARAPPQRRGGGVAASRCEIASGRPRSPTGRPGSLGRRPAPRRRRRSAIATLVERLRSACWCTCRVGTAPRRSARSPRTILTLPGSCAGP